MVTKSQQMPASQRKATQAAAASRSTQPRSRRPSAASGSYANCDFDDFEDPAPRMLLLRLLSRSSQSPEITDEERAYYASRQAPRSVRLQKQKDLEQQRAQAAADAAKAQAVDQAVGIRASDEPAQPELLNQPGNQAGQTVLVPPSAPADKIAEALNERKAVVVQQGRRTSLLLRQQRVWGRCQHKSEHHLAKQAFRPSCVHRRFASDAMLAPVFLRLTVRSFAISTRTITTQRSISLSSLIHTRTTREARKWVPMAGH